MGGVVGFGLETSVACVCVRVRGFCSLGCVIWSSLVFFLRVELGFFKLGGVKMVFED